MTSIDSQDIQKGNHGEEFFMNIASHFFFSEDMKAHDPDTGMSYSLADLRKTKTEGEFSLPDGSLIEVKSDFRCYETDNIITEMSGRYGDAGWFEHCKFNGVRYLIYILYRGETKPLPYCTVMFNFSQFASYVDNLMKSEQYVRRNLRTTRDKDGSTFQILKIRLEDAVKNCNPLVSYTQECQEEIMSILTDSLNRIGRIIGVKFDSDSSLRECVIQRAQGGESIRE